MVGGDDHAGRRPAFDDAHDELATSTHEPTRRVNSIDPAVTATVQASWAPIMRVADPHEIAQGALFLASDESSFAVGSCLVLDGGFTAK